MIRRKEGEAIGGYETEDGKEVFIRYMSGLSGFLTKQVAAYEFFKALEKVDRGKTELFKYSSDYVRDMLRNQTDLDKYSGKARSLAFAWSLAGNMKSAVMQLTQNLVTGIPVLGRSTRSPQKKYVKAMMDVASGNLTEIEKKAVGDAIETVLRSEGFEQRPVPLDDLEDEPVFPLDCDIDIRLGQLSKH